MGQEGNMPVTAPKSVTQLLQDSSRGDKEALGARAFLHHELRGKE
jgi:hypothetical protein